MENKNQESNKDEARMNFFEEFAKLKPDNVGCVSRGTEKLMERQIRNKQTERHLRSESLFLVSIAEFGWFLFSALTDASETDQFLFDSHTNTHLCFCTYGSLHLNITNLKPPFPNICELR